MDSAFDYEHGSLRLDWVAVYKIDRLHRECDGISFREAVELTRKQQRREEPDVDVDDVGDLDLIQ